MKSQQIRAIYLSGALVLAAGTIATVSARPSAPIGIAATAPDDAVPQMCRNTRQQPRILILVFQGSDSLGRIASDSVRQAWAQRECPRYFPVPYADIASQLGGSGFDPTKALTGWDQSLLAKLLSADVVLTGSVTSAPGRWTITTSLAVPTDHRVTQPLETITANRLTLAARNVLPVVTEALKAYPEFRKCWIAEGDKRHEDAVKAANAAIAAYPPSTMARICLAQALHNLKASPDSILTVTNYVLKVNPRDYFAIRFTEYAERDKGNTARADSLMIELLALNPTDVGLQEEVIRKFADSKNFAMALKIVADAKNSNPGAPEIVSLEATICMATKDWKCAIAAYEELGKSADTAAVNISYFERLITAHRELKQFKEAAAAAGRGRSKFPDHVPMILYVSQMRREGGDTVGAIAAAKEALAKDPTQFNVYITVLASMASAPPDAIIEQVKGALPHAKTQADSATLHNFAFSPGQVLYNQASTVPDSLKTEADWQKIEMSIKLIEFAHSIVPDDLDKFFLSLENYLLGARDFNAAQKLQDPTTGKILDGDKKKVCDLTTAAYNRVTKAQEWITTGGNKAVGRGPTQDNIRNIMQTSNTIQIAAGTLKGATC